MKFTDGYWLMRPGCTARFATEVADVRADEHRMTLYAPVKHVTRRGGTLNSPLLTVDCWSPAEGAIGVRTTHHAGSVRRGPEFALPGAEEGVGKVHRDGSLLELVSGELSLRVDTSGPWRLEFTADGQVLTSAGKRGTGFVTDAAGRHHMVGQLALGVGELTYDLLVAPVFTDDGTVEYYVPEGTWTNILTGARLTGPRWVRERHDFHTLPLLARPNSVIPLAADDQHPVSVWPEDVELRVHAFADGAERTVVIPRPDGPGEAARFRVRREGDRLSVTTDSPCPWRLRTGGPAGTLHTKPPGTTTTDVPHEDADH